MKGGSYRLWRVMDWRQRKRESDGERDIDAERERKPGLSFVASTVKAQQGEPPWQFVRGATLIFQGSRSSTAVTSTRLTKPRDKSFTPTPSLLTLLIYPACLWLLPPHRQQLLSRALFFSLLNSSFPLTEILSNGNIISVLYFILFNFSLKLCLTYLAAF